jgi:hypothetical protein
VRTEHYAAVSYGCGFASDTFTNAYVAEYYREFRVSLSKSFVSVSKFLSATRPHYCFYVPLVSVSSLSCCSFGRSPESTHSGGSHRVIWPSYTVMIWHTFNTFARPNPGYPVLSRQWDWQISRHICNRRQDNTYGITNQGLFNWSLCLTKTTIGMPRTPVVRIDHARSPVISQRVNHQFQGK